MTATTTLTTLLNSAEFQNMGLLNEALKRPQTYRVTASDLQVLYATNKFLGATSAIIMADLGQKPNGQVYTGEKWDSLAFLDNEDFHNQLMLLAANRHVVAHDLGNGQYRLTADFESLREALVLFGAIRPAGF